VPRSEKLSDRISIQAEMSERFKNVIIAHDMTVKEREARKAPVEETKSKTDKMLSCRRETALQGAL